MGWADRGRSGLIQCLGDLGEEETAAAPEVLEDPCAGAAGKKFVTQGGVEGGVEAVCEEDKVDIGVGKEGSGLVGVGATDGVTGEWPDRSGLTGKGVGGRRLGGPGAVIV